MKFWTPEIPELPEVRLKKPGTCCPRCQRPTRYRYRLKESTTGWCQFPNPGPGISMSGILIGNRPPVPAISTGPARYPG